MKTLYYSIFYDSFCPNTGKSSENSENYLILIIIGQNSQPNKVLADKKNEWWKINIIKPIDHFTRNLKLEKKW